MRITNQMKTGVAGGALLLSGLAIGAAVLGNSAASAAGGSITPSSVANGPANHARPFDPSKSVRPDEHLLTGSTASKVRSAALAKYPGATVQRVETDSDGVYEAHIVTKAGQAVIVQVGKSFTVTGIDTGGGPGMPGRSA
jgi:hypothetical protein